MKNIITLAVSLFSLTIFAQVGINNNTPKATLDITAQTTNGSKPEGLLPPRLTGDQIQAGDAQYTAAQAGIIIYATAAATAPSTKTANITAAGYYFYDGSAWQKLTGATGDTTNDAWVNDTGNTMVKVGTKADGTTRTAGTDVVIMDNGSVGLGTGTPNASAVLDITATNKGMLIPRVALTSSTDVTTITSPAAGLLVYNTGTGALTFKGFVFWNGTEWRQIDNTIALNPVITNLKCSDAILSPTQLIAGTPYSGYMYVPYKGGNGSNYSAGSSIISLGNTGLTATLQPGKLAFGDGTFSYLVTGTPSQNSPNLASFTLPTTFGATGCTTNVGNSSATGSDVRKVIYSAAAPDPNQSVSIGGMIFRIVNLSGVWGPQLALTSSVAKKIYVGMNQQFATNGFEYANWTKTFTVANATTFQNIPTDSSFALAPSEINIFNIIDEVSGAYYRVTMYYVANSFGTNTYTIIAEQF